MSCYRAAWTVLSLFFTFFTLPSLLNCTVIVLSICGLLALSYADRVCKYYVQIGELTP